jgi:uncharacterized protein (TIGR00290 family)
LGANYALMWSGGKDSALALQRATAAGIHIARLINFYDATTHRVRFHATRTEMIRAQAHAAGIELDAISTTWPEMESRLGEELATLRSEGFAGVVFGDIHLADVREWYESRVRAAGLEHLEPIWGGDPAGLVREFVESGGRAVITCVDLSRLDSSWLGRIIDERFLEEIGATRIDPCGENGEFHSFAFQGPAFADPINWRSDQMRSESGFSQLDILPELTNRP